jgi:hypothetical protein
MGKLKLTDQDMAVIVQEALDRLPVGFVIFGGGPFTRQAPR